MHIHSRQSLEATHGLLAPPYNTRDPLLPALGAAWLALLHRLEARRRARRAFAELAAMDDRMLADIGVKRCDIPRAAREVLPLDGHR